MSIKVKEETQKSKFFCPDGCASSIFLVDLNVIEWLRESVLFLLLYSKMHRNVRGAVFVVIVVETVAEYVHSSFPCTRSDVDVELWFCKNEFSKTRYALV